MVTEEERPSKRLKTVHQIAKTSDSDHTTGSKDIKQTEGHTANEARKRFRNGRTKAAHGNTNNSLNRPATVRTFSQPSAICAGDKGIFVTCDKGREKKSLLELQDLVQQYLDEHSIGTMGEILQLDPEMSDAIKSEQASNVQNHAPEGIEADIAAELEDMKQPASSDQVGTKATKSMQLITLDVPCVSFLRLPPGSAIDPVQMVHTICDQAASSASQKSRYIQRLTPVSRLEKVLNDGLDKASDAVLPLHFAKSTDAGIQSFTFAIRPTVRNNDKIGRDEIIKTVAAKVQLCGEIKHKVDLKCYEKGILVEVYRGWVGVSVIDNVATEIHQKGYEALKRFNLAEIYAGK